MLRFLVFSDLHYDEVTDGDERIENILANVRDWHPDFIVSLGDLCNPVSKNQNVLAKFHSLNIPFYSVIGNHETDYCRLSEILDFFSLKKPYYSVVCNNYKLIFLCTCYFKTYGQEELYYQKNFKNDLSVYPIVPMDELQWLQEELKDNKEYIIFSHHSLVNDFVKRGVANREDIRKMFVGKRVLLCMNGHDHGDSYSLVNEIPYMTVNSANYAWLGGQIASSEELQKKYSYLNGILQYKQAMSAYIEIDDREIRICGMEGEYLSVTPKDIGLYDYKWNGVSVRPQITSHLIKR